MDIRIVSRPIAPPWDSGSMNMAFGVATHLGHNDTVNIPVVKGFAPTIDGVVINPIFSSKKNNNLSKIQLLRYIIDGYDSDILHFFFGPSLLTKSIISLLLKIVNKPTVLTLTHILPEGIDYHLFGSEIVTYSEYHADLLHNKGITNVTHIPPGVDTDVIHPRFIGDCLRKKLMIPYDSMIVLYAGEYSKSADLNALLESVEICIRKNRNIIFIFACRVRKPDEFARKKKVEESIKERNLSKNVVLIDKVSNLHQLISQSNVCVLPLYDTFRKVDLPLFLLEAMAFAKPIVVTEIPPLTELVREPVGFAVPVNNGGELADAILEALSMQTILGKQGRKCIEQRFSLLNVASQYKQIYKGLV